MTYTKTIKGKEYEYSSYRGKDGKVHTKYLGPTSRAGETRTHDKIRHGLLFILEIVGFFFLFATIAVMLAINAADFKMNTIYPNMCSCNYTPTLYFNQTVIDQCKVDCAEMRSDERSLTIGFLSICIFGILYTLYGIIKRRVKAWLEKKRKQ